MIRFNIDIGNIPPLILCTRECTKVFRQLGVRDLSINFDTDGNIILAIACRNESPIDLLHENLMSLTLPKTVHGRQFVWVKCKNGLIKHIFNADACVTGETVLSIIIHPHCCVIYFNHYIHELDIIAIMVDCFKQITPGDVITSMWTDAYYMRWHETIKVMPELAELMAHLMSEKIIGQISY